MSKLDDLINTLCPNGVEYKTLGDLAKIKNGKDYKHLKEGNVPVYGSGGIMTYVDTAVYFEPTVLIPRKGSLNNLFYVDVPFWNVDTIFYTEINTEVVVPKFLYYFLAKSHLEDLNKAGGVPSLTQSILNKITIPVPPLEVQNEIVRILDKFTSLEAELEARRKQYEYYRDSLLTFGDDVEWKTIGELCTVKAGGEPPENVSPIKDLNHPYPIWGNGKEIYGFTDSYIIEQDAVAISSIGANTGAVFFHTGMFTPIIRLKVLLPKENSLLSKYLFYACSRIEFNTKKSSVPNMSAADVKRKKIPLPSLSEQQRIVNILDRFESLCNDITSGLPAEIEARHKQYEYYRDKLLTFNRKEV